MSDRAPDSVPEVAARLEWVRHHFGQSAKQFALALGVWPAAYSNWLHGKYGLSLDGAKRIRRVYGVSLDFLFFGDTQGLPENIRTAWALRPYA